MGKHGATFERAFAVDYVSLARLARKRFKVTLEYDERAHVLEGPLLTDVLRLADVELRDSMVLSMRAVDGYAPTLTLADARRYAYILASQMDDRPLPLGGLGPLWAVYEADRFPEIASKPVNQRFASCPWALYHIDVRRE